MWMTRRSRRGNCFAPLERPLFVRSSLSHPSTQTITLFKHALCSTRRSQLVAGAALGLVPLTASRRRECEMKILLTHDLKMSKGQLRWDGCCGLDKGTR